MVSVFRNGCLWNYPTFLVGLALIGLAGCTGMAPSTVPPRMLDVDLGPTVELRVCIYQDEGVSDEQAADIIAAIQKA